MNIGKGNMTEHINTIIQGNNIDVLKTFPDNCIDSIVCDPPYGLSFMGKKWDYDVPSIELWSECLRVLKPGGYLLAFAGTRTQHRMAVRIEDSGFIIRDMVAWVYGSGFPKSLNIGKAVDKLQGNEREVNGSYKVPDIKGDAYGTMNEKQGGSYKNIEVNKTKGTSEYEGFGTALKPAFEPITVAMKPLSEKNFALNVLKWGTGGLNIDGCRVDLKGIEKHKTPCKGKLGRNGIYGSMEIKSDEAAEFMRYNSLGRFPANFIHDGSEEVVECFPETTTGEHKETDRTETYNNSTIYNFPYIPHNRAKNSGNASRFFYCAKADKSERNLGCGSLEKKFTKTMNDGIGKREHNENEITAYNNNNHPTVKPIDLCRYLCKLVTPKNGIVLDPFAGSGTTLIGAKLENFNYIGIEREEEYCTIARNRINAYFTQLKMEL